MFEGGGEGQKEDGDGTQRLTTVGEAVATGAIGVVVGEFIATETGGHTHRRQRLAEQASETHNT